MESILSFMSDNVGLSLSVLENRRRLRIISAVFLAPILILSDNIVTPSIVSDRLILSFNFSISLTF